MFSPFFHVYQFWYYIYFHLQDIILTQVCHRSYLARRLHATGNQCMDLLAIRYSCVVLCLSPAQA